MSASAQASPEEDASALMTRGNALHQQGRLDEALACYQAIASDSPLALDAQHVSGVLRLQQGRMDQAIALIGGYLSQRPGDAHACFNLMQACRCAGLWAEVRALAQRLGEIQPDYPGLAAVLQQCRGQTGPTPAAHAQAVFERSRQLWRQGQKPQAVESLQGLLAWAPHHGEGLSLMANALFDLGQLPQALAFYDRAVAARPSHAITGFNRSVLLERLGRHEEANAGYRQLLSHYPDHPGALYNLANNLRALQPSAGRTQQALAYYQRLLAVQPQHVNALNNCGSTLHDLRQPEAALALYERGLALEPEHGPLLFNRATLLAEQGRLQETAATLERLLTVSPHYPYARSQLISACRFMADWSRLPAHEAQLRQQLSGQPNAALPLLLLPQPGITQDAHRHCARHFARHKMTPAQARPLCVPGAASAPRPADERLRIVYLSADLRQHPVMAVMARVFELHDRRRFHVSLCNYGRVTADAMRQRLAPAFDALLDVADWSDEQIARHLHAQRAEVVIDLMGYTSGTRSGLLAWRPAPVAVNYLGYPATLGAPWIDYIIGDGVLMPPGEDALYDERIVRLPCYLPHDPLRTQALPTLTRASQGLPPDALVFCAFSHTYKIHPQVFEVWMRLLQAVPASVLWLLQGDPAAAHLRQRAAAHGIDPGRLVFAARASYPEYMARYVLGDLFLDTWPYNALATASDALWMGLPVLSCTGHAYVGRGATSLLRACGLHDALAAPDLPAYERRALALAQSPAELADLKNRLIASRQTSAHFDVAGWTRGYEAALVYMADRARQGLAPAPFDIDAQGRASDHSAQGAKTTAAPGSAPVAVPVTVPATDAPPPEPAAPKPAAPVWNEVLALYHAGQHAQARAACQGIVQAAPADFDALTLLGAIAFEQGQLQQALSWFEAALAARPGSALALTNKANVLATQRQLSQALDCLDQAVALQPEYESAWRTRARVLTELERLPEALSSYDRVLALAPACARAWNSQGNLLLGLGRYDEALTSYSQAVALDPGHADTWNNRGYALFRLDRLDQALQDLDQALALAPGHVTAWGNRGNLLLALQRPRQALASYDRALALDAAHAGNWLSAARALMKLQQPAQALTRFDQTLALEPRQPDACNERGIALFELGQPAQALQSYDQALALDPGHADAWSNRAAALNLLGRASDALSSYDRALTLDPGHANALRMRVHLAQHLADWGQLPAQSNQVLQQLRTRAGPGDQALHSAPFPLLSISGVRAADELAAARQYVAQQFATSATSAVAVPGLGARAAHPRLRVAYLSADFHDHPMARLMAEVFELHDRSRLETFAIAFDPVAPDAMRQRLRAAFDHFIDIHTLTDEQALTSLRALEIDIAIDLMGHTQHSRFGLFVQRIAPVQVNYLGYPATSGSACIDYIVGDRWVTPVEDAAFFSEQIVWLPDSFQANDRQRVIGPTPTRAALGLPGHGFVFCCFNNIYKITPPVFELWLHLLRQLPASVLWLASGRDEVVRNLRAQAQAQGVDGARLVFAPRLPYAQYMAQYRVADLFLDTLPFNAGTTASDALWAGLPVLTQRGATFAGRMAASLLAAVGLPQLITASAAEYQALALRLATHPAEYQALRQQLARQRASAALFDTPRFTRHLEQAYQTMWQRHQQGLAPQAFAVEPLV